jgi:hypothetical protein
MSQANTKIEAKLPGVSQTVIFLETSLFPAPERLRPYKGVDHESR